MAPRRRQITLTEPRTIRALTHPARMTVIDELYGGRVATSTELAELTGLTPSAMSYHLRALEKHGIVERDASASDARERPWRAAGSGISINSAPTRAQQAAAGLLLTGVFEDLREKLETYVAAELKLPAEWRQKANFSTAVMYLTPDETRAMIDALEAARAPFERKSKRRRKGTRRVRTALLVTPEAE